MASPKLPPRATTLPDTESAAEESPTTDADVVLEGQQRNKADEGVPFGVRAAAAWTWRLIVLGAGVYFLIQAIGMVQVVIVPTVIALMLTALLQPGAAWLHRHKVPNGLAAGLMLITGLLFVGGTLYGVIHAFISGFGDLSDKVEGGIEEIRTWLTQGPLHMSNKQLDEAFKSVGDFVSDNRDTLTEGLLNTATVALEMLAGFFIVLFATFFFIKDGKSIWSFLLYFIPRSSRSAIDKAGHYAWRTLISYVRATVLVAFVDAVGIGGAAWLLDVPLALPIAALVFLTAFIPVVGATLSGAVAVLVALVTQGPVTALILLAAVIAVQQLEGHVLQPFLMGRAVSIHPLAVILAIGAGGVLGGIMGAVVSVPLVAMVNTAVRYLARQQRGEPVPPGEAEPPGTHSTDPDQAALEEQKAKKDKKRPASSTVPGIQQPSQAE